MSVTRKEKEIPIHADLSLIPWQSLLFSHLTGRNCQINVCGSTDRWFINGLSPIFRISLKATC